MARLVPVVLAGGEGTRLWPMSRADWPKQFIAFSGSTSPFQQALERVGDRRRYDAPIVVTNQTYRFVVSEQARLGGWALGGILLEPVVRNTAAAIIAAAVFERERSGGDTVLHVLPSDHALVVDPAYLAAVETAAGVAAEGRLVTFGVRATRPETGYGYIEAGRAASGIATAIGRFVEKPAPARAEAMLASGDFLWNSGMFMFRIDDLLSECRSFIPATVAAVETAVIEAYADTEFTWLQAEAFAQAPEISIDRGVFERTRRASVVPVDMEWSDLGSWDAVWKAGAKDTAGNVVLGAATLSNTARSLVLSGSGHVAVDGLEDTVVVVSDDAVFVGRLSASQGMSAMVTRLRAHPATAGLTRASTRCHRPWGGFVNLVETEHFKVKRLFVNPGQRLSLQKHAHRAEHWVVVAGIADVTRGAETTRLGTNESAFIALGEVHRLANAGTGLLEVIEVQTGDYLGEDDIVRLDDAFGRH